MVTIFHNPRCPKSREGLKYLESKTADFSIYEYLKVGLTRENLNEIILKSGLKPFDLIRTQEKIYKKELKGRKFTDNEWIAIILENPVLLQRPIVIGKYKAVLAFPAEKIEGVLKKQELLRQEQMEIQTEK